MLYITILSLILIILVFLAYMGVFTKLRVIRTKLGPLKIFYLEYIGEYKKIGPKYNKICTDMSIYFKFARPVGIFYDSPDQIEDLSKCRAVIGFLVNPGESPEKSREFQENHKEYKFADLPIVNALKTVFPYRNFLTFFLFKMIYKAFTNEVLKLEGNLECEGCMEIYYINNGSSEIEFYWIKGINSDKYLLTSEPKPNYKEIKYD